MEAEEMEYEMEQRSQSVANNVGDDDILRDDRYNYPITEAYQYRKETASLPITFPSTAATTSGDNYWCYHCTSPLNIMSGNMQHAIEKFLRIRRTVYPAHVKNIRCAEPRNLTELAVEYCRYSYCQTLILMDHDTGTSFTIRGCAETFGAINERLLDTRSDNTCQKLHEQLDIQECICRQRRYCYPGAKRRIFGASANSLFKSSSSTHKIVSLFYGILIIYLKFIFYYHF
ncbi:hypothetical protein DINM_000254 [Dirofilaria immitis]|nr:hypothetical protein [Dirofilaria immitis]